MPHWTAIANRTKPEERRHMAEARFITLGDVAEVLNISASQTYALVRSGELAAIKIGGRGQWRVERDQLENYIARMYDQTKQFVAEHPFVDSSTEPSGE
jgi:excisionase family DNA binding protein